MWEIIDKLKLLIEKLSGGVIRKKDYYTCAIDRFL